MPTAEAQTRERILLSALALFAERGIAATSLDEVARRAGVTRVTVYRHFVDKENLTLEAFLRIEQLFIRGLDVLKRDPHANGEKVLSDIGAGLSALPSGDVFARTEELKRLYPAAYAAVQKVRVATLNGLFENLFSRSRRMGRLRPGLDRQLIQAVFWELTVNVFDNPRLRSLGMTDAQLYRSITDILLHGILQDK